MSKGKRIKLTMHTLMYHGIGRVSITCKVHGKQSILALEYKKVVLSCGCKLDVPD